MKKGICKKGHEISGDNVYHLKDGTSRCKICKRSLDNAAEKRRLENPIPHREACKRYYAKKPQQLLIWRYGITFEKKREMEVLQKGFCAICFCVMKTPCVDHDHNTKQVRELLCRNCNLGIGHLQEDVLILESALAYLKKWKS